MRVGRREVQTAVRGLLTIWGLPGEMRVDNGAPWGSWGDLPPDLALWLMGLGGDMLWNRPRHKPGNAVVERAHGVLQRWSEPERCADAATLSQRLAALTTVPRERYPVRGGQSRLALYPTLATGGRPYAPAREADLFDERRVWAALGRGVRQRRVDKVGRISVYNRALTVGRPWAGQTVTVRLVVQEESPPWVIADERGQPLATHPASELSRERILNPEVSHRRIRRPKAKPAVRKEGYPCAR